MEQKDLDIIIDNLIMIATKTNSDTASFSVTRNNGWKVTLSVTRPANE